MGTSWVRRYMVQNYLGEKVFVYRNLHRKCYSVKSLKTGRVIAHVDSIDLINVVFRVSEAGRQRVLKTRQKNVHAGVVGYIADVSLLCQSSKVTYNPYRFDSFINKDNEMPIYEAKIARIDASGITVA
jgi:hypothetical protein